MDISQVWRDMTTGKLIPLFTELYERVQTQNIFKYVLSYAIIHLKLKPKTKYVPAFPGLYTRDGKQHSTRQTTLSFPLVCPVGAYGLSASDLR